NDAGVALDGSGSDQRPADQVVAEIKKAGGKAAANHANVTTMAGGESIIKTALDSFGRLDILVNNAGILRDRMIFNMAEEEWDAVIAVHLKGHFSCGKAASVVFRQQRSGRIINTASIAALGNMGQANYSTAKNGIVGMTQTWARELGRYGVTANCLFPGATTRMTDRPELREAQARSVAAGIRAAPAPAQAAPAVRDPAGVSPIVVWLSTDEASNVNGWVFAASWGEVGVYSPPRLGKALYKDGYWTVDEVAEVFPRTLGEGLVNKWPPQAPK
ncbi:MAG: SDR family NAD(P)-dependent oxidoreductase, partial [Chloroflexi bacterium]|nr:SDR family NAD(P)-dependent oxidoreductase [Chloroflexota bacterium]